MQFQKYKKFLLLTSETDDGVQMTWTCVDLAEEIVNSSLAQWREILSLEIHAHLFELDDYKNSYFLYEQCWKEVIFIPDQVGCIFSGN